MSTAAFMTDNEEGSSVVGRPRVLVMACRGADQGAMNVVRTLGRRGIAVSVLSDSKHSLTRHSRYCQEFICMPDFTQDEVKTLAMLIAFSKRQEQRPVLFPTADPDLALISKLRKKLEAHYSMFLSPPDLITAFSDKREFIKMSQRYDFPTPKTYAPGDRAQFVAISKNLRYPVVLKPANPNAWTKPEVQAIVGYKKALIVERAEDLVGFYSQLAPWNTDLVVQEYIVGPDENHYSAHVYMNRSGEPVACFTGQKLRVQPAFAGSGCFVRSVHVPELVETSLRVLRAVNYQGVAVLNFKLDERTKEFKLHEINPRVSQWNLLATACGVDVPFAAYAEAANVPCDAMMQQSEHKQYVDLRNDVKSFVDYRTHGLLSTTAYISSLFAKHTVHQVFALDDPVPALRCLATTLRGAWRRVARGKRSALGPASPGSDLKEPAPAQAVASPRGQGWQRSRQELFNSEDSKIKK